MIPEPWGRDTVAWLLVDQCPSFCWRQNEIQAADTNDNDDGGGGGNVSRLKSRPQHVTTPGINSSLWSTMSQVILHDKPCKVTQVRTHYKWEVFKGWSSPSLPLFGWRGEDPERGKDLPQVTHQVVTESRWDRKRENQWASWNRNTEPAGNLLSGQWQERSVPCRWKQLTAWRWKGF